jgi:hypothetical protein
MKSWIGIAIVIIGIIHIVVGFLLIGQVGLELIQEGLFNTIHGEPMREAFFWFTFSGFCLIILGQTVHWMESRSIQVPAFLGWSLFGITLLTVCIMPVSGAWLMFIPVYGLIRNKVFSAKTGRRDLAK